MNTIEFCIGNYLINDNISFEEARNVMNNDIMNLLGSLLTNKYVIVVKQNYENIITVEFEYSNVHYSNQKDTKNPYWITKSEYNYINNKDFYDKLP